MIIRPVVNVIDAHCKRRHRQQKRQKQPRKKKARVGHLDHLRFGAAGFAVGVPGVFKIASGWLVYRAMDGERTSCQRPPPSARAAPVSRAGFARLIYAKRLAMVQQPALFRRGTRSGPHPAAQAPSPRIHVDGDIASARTLPSAHVPRRHAPRHAQARWGKAQGARGPLGRQRLAPTV